jgi:RHS repeat-associated protein
MRRRGVSYRSLAEVDRGELRPSIASAWRRPLAVFVSLASALSGLFIFTPAVVVHADNAQRTSWNATSRQMYRLEGSNGATWVPMDPSKLVLAVTPAVNSAAVLSAFADVESSTAVNTEVGISVNGTVVAWKDGGEYTGSSPDPVYIQQPYSMTAGTTYSLELMWRATTPMSPGVFLEAGDPVPPTGPGFSPSTINALLTPSSDNYVASAVSPGSVAFSTSSATWTIMDTSVQTSFTTPAGGSNFSTLLTASADLYSLSSAFTNADMGICLAASSSINSTCTSTGASIIAAQTSGSATGAMPIASLVDATATLTPSTTYTMAIFWQAAAAHAIYAGAGVAGAVSLISLIAQMTPTTDAELATVATTSIQTRAYSGTDDGTPWETIGSESYSITPSVNVLTYLTANATLAIASGIDPIDYGICVISGTQTCNTAGSNIVAETASRVLPPIPDAASLQVPVFMTAGTAYTVTLEWRAGYAMSSGQSMSAGRTIAGPMTEETTLTSLEVPYSSPSAPPSASATAGNGQATVSWTASTSSPGSPLTGYAVTPWLGTTALQSMRVGNVTSFTVPNLANGQAYSFTVAGVNAVGAGATTSTTAVTLGLPGAPTGVTIGTRGNGFENLSWTAPGASGASAITGYVVTPYIAGVAQTTTTIWGTGTATTITGLTDGTNYTFGVSAINVFGTGAAGTSGANDPVTQVPGTPTGVQATAGNGQATVTWTVPASNGGASISSYTITPYIGGTAQSTTSSSSSPGTVIGLTNGTTYTFTVAAVNSVGSGAASSNSWAVIPATTPIVPTLSMAVDGGTGATYAIGTEVTYTATIASNAGIATTATFADALPLGVSGTGGLVEVNGAACSGGTTCTATPTSVLVSGLAVPATGNVVVTYSLTVIGSLSRCAREPDNAGVTLAGGNSVGAVAQFTACDSGLGTPMWNSFITQTLGDGGSAGVNPANGNLVVTQSDAIPMKLHGGLSFGLSRTYNSEDKDLAGLTEPVGNGWIVSFVDAGSQPGGVGLIVPPIESYANPTPITMVDGTGTRYVYTLAALSAVINVGSLSTTGPLATAIPNNLPKTTGYNQRCIDEEYNVPAGLHVSMWRYVETTGTCATLSTSSNLIIGYVALGTDRVRREYNALGQLLNLQDAAGNTVFYSYTSGQLTAVTETGNSRKFKLAYAGSTVTVTDPGGEKTIYTLAANNDLSSVANPDGTGLSYTYGTACNGDSYKQICSATDGRGHTTNFTYQVAPNGPPMVATIVDRNGNTTTITYNASNVTADRGIERTAYAAIDASGRVGEVDAGSTSNLWLNQTFYGWDTAAAGCRQPEAGVDNDLCFIIRRGLTAGAPDRVTDYVYSDEGQMLSQREVNYPTDLYTTAGYQDEYFEDTVAVSAYTDSVAGSGSVTSSTQTGGRKDAGTLFDVITQTQSLTPRGNAAGSGFATYLTTFLVDNNTGVSTNTVNAASSLCGTPASPTANTGLLCEIEAPSFDGTHVTQTNYTHNPDGTRATMTTPKENAESLGNHYVYTYYQNTDNDLSGTTSAGGWLKGITDPTGSFTTFAYDAEGQQVRSWDRNATSADGVALSSTNWNSLTLAPAAFTETLYTDGGDTSASTFSAPGRYALATRSQLGQWTTDTVDNNGNLIGTRSPNGSGGSSTSIPSCPQPTSGQTNDTCRTYDKNDNLLTTLTPMEANTANYGSQKFTTDTYDAFDNRVSATDANGHMTATVYDNLNRATETFWTMAAWGAMPTPAGCVESSSGNIPISTFPTGDIMCSSSTAYDGVDNPISSTNATGNTSDTLFDAVHRAIATTTPRDDGIFSNLVTVTLYNQDGKATDVCPPRELSDGGVDSYVCNSTSTYGTHTTYNAAGWIANSSSYQAAGAPDTTTYGYDADGNKTTITNANGFATTYVYSVLDRMNSMTVPRTSTTSYTTTYGYDPSGDETYEYAPVDGTNLIRTEYTYDADHRVIDSVTGASVANSTAAYSGTNGTDVRTRNVYDADGNIVEQYQPNAFTASGVTPDADYATGAAYNADNEQAAVYTPRYDTGAHTPSLTDAVGTTQSATQAADCPAGGVSGFGYASTLGICTSSYQYDPVGNVSVVNWPTQTSSDRKPLTTYSYTNTNLVLTETDPNPNAGGGTVTAETYAYDAQGKQTAKTDANGIYIYTAYTADEHIAATTQTPNATTTHITSYLYDANGAQTQVTDALGNSTLTAYYPVGLTKSVTDGVGDETSYVYDAVGNPTAVFSPDANAKAPANLNGVPTYNVYTEDNLLEATLVPVNATDTQRAVCYKYDQSGRKTGQGNWLNTGAVISTEPSACGGGVPANSFAFTNLPDGRLAKETARNGTSALSYTYDANGNQLTSTDSTNSVTTTNTYYADDLLRTAQDMTTNYRVTDYAYDGAGKVTGRNSVPSSGTTYKNTLTYTDADLQATETNNISTWTTTWSYDAGGRPVQLLDGYGDQTSYNYAADGTLDEKYMYNNGGLGLSDFTQTLDGDYHVTSDGCSFCDNTAGTANIGHTFTYQYDAAGRLIFIDASGGAAAFQTYDQDGNRITHDDVVTDAYTNYTYNADNSIATTILSGTAVNATYDTYGAGVMISDGCEKWTLDTFDRATTLAPVTTPPSVCPAAPPTTTYTYDANGTMVTEAASGTTATIHNDPTSSTPIAETVGSTTTAYVLDSAGTPIEAAQGSTDLFLTDDPKGDLSAVAGTSSLYPTCQIQYDPYGTVVFGLSASNVCETGSTFADLLYQNTRRDGSSGTYQLGSRTYDPSKNSFLSPDHFQEGTPAQDLSLQVDPLTENAYTFADGDPVNQFDPSGHLFTTGCEDDPSGCTPAQQACDNCRVYPTSGNHGHGPGGCANCAKPGPPVPKPKPAPPRSPLLKAHIAQEVAQGFAALPRGSGLDAACVYEGGDNTVCPDWQGNYDLTPSEYEAGGGYAPGDPRPQGTTWADVFEAGATFFALVNLVDGEGEAQLGGEAAWFSANAGADSGVAATEGAGAEGGALRIFATEGRAAAAERAGALNPGESGNLFATSGQYEYGNIAQSNLAMWNTRGANVAGYWDVPAEYASKFAYVGRAEAKLLWEGGGPEFTWSGSIQYDALGPFRLIPWAAGR